MIRKLFRMFQMARLERELRHMSDRTLRDIGISRNEIPDVVRTVFGESAARPVSVANTNTKSSLAA